MCVNGIKSEVAARLGKILLNRVHTF